MFNEWRPEPDPGTPQYREIDYEFQNKEGDYITSDFKHDWTEESSLDPVDMEKMGQLVDDIVHASGDPWPYLYLEKDDYYNKGSVAVEKTTVLKPITSGTVTFVAGSFQSGGEYEANYNTTVVTAGTTETAKIDVVLAGGEDIGFAMTFDTSRDAVKIITGFDGHASRTVTNIFLEELHAYTRDIREEDIDFTGFFNVYGADDKLLYTKDLTSQEDYDWLQELFFPERFE